MFYFLCENLSNNLQIIDHHQMHAPINIKIVVREATKATLELATLDLALLELASGIGSPIVVDVRYLSMTKTPGTAFLFVPSSPGQMNASLLSSLRCFGWASNPSTVAILGKQHCGWV